MNSLCWLFQWFTERTIFLRKGLNLWSQNFDQFLFLLDVSNCVWKLNQFSLIIFYFLLQVQNLLLFFMNLRLQHFVFVLQSLDIFRTFHLKTFQLLRKAMILFCSFYDLIFYNFSIILEFSILSFKFYYSLLGLLEILLVSIDLMLQRFAEFLFPFNHLIEFFTTGTAFFCNGNIFLRLLILFIILSFLVLWNIIFTYVSSHFSELLAQGVVLFWKVIKFLLQISVLLLFLLELHNEMLVNLNNFLQISQFHMAELVLGYEIQRLVENLVIVGGHSF